MKPSTTASEADARPDPEDMRLLRQKLTQIAVGPTSMEQDQDQDQDQDEPMLSGRFPAPMPPARVGHFRAFLPMSDHPSTPPSSPQPRDVLRRQLLRKKESHISMGPVNMTRHASLEGGRMCIDGVDISPLPTLESLQLGMTSEPSVRLSVPEDLRIMSSTFRVLHQCPEGIRKRKCMSMSMGADGRHDVLADTNVAPLKKASSQVNVLSGARWEGWTGCADHEMEDVGASKRRDRCRRACS